MSKFNATNRHIVIFIFPLIAYSNCGFHVCTFFNHYIYYTVLILYLSSYLFSEQSTAPMKDQLMDCRLVPYYDASLSCCHFISSTFPRNILYSLENRCIVAKCYRHFYCVYWVQFCWLSFTTVCATCYLLLSAL